MSFLLDTDTSSAHLKSAGPVGGRFIQYGGRLHVSTVTVGELYTWALRASASPRRLLSLEELLTDVQVLDVSRDVARRFGKMRAERLDAGRPVPDMDLLIAATALVHGLTLVTHNTKDFENIPGLAVDDWLAP